MKRITFLTALFPLLFGLFGIVTVRADETTDKVRQGLGLGFVTLSTSSTSAIPTTAVSTPVGKSTGEVCYSCFFQNDPEVKVEKVASFFQNFQTKNPLLSGDARYIVWRATGKKDCGALGDYARVTGDPLPRLTANANIAFGAAECNVPRTDEVMALDNAAKLAAELGRMPESRALSALAVGKFRPKFGDVKIESALEVPSGAKSMVLGGSTIVIAPGTRIGTQVERVWRDWLGTYWDGVDDFSWDLTPYGRLPIARDDGGHAHHEGALVEHIQQMVDVTVVPLVGTLIANNGDAWYGPDDQGVFRFEILEDKVQYPTTHTNGNVGWITDTHGISAIVSQAVQTKSRLVIGCGDYEGKVKAAYYLAQKDIDVVFPGDRYEYQLIGYKGMGTLIGTAPVKRVNNQIVIGHQPVRFFLSELIVAEDTTQSYPTQYYDAAAKYFRQLAKSVELNVRYVNVSDENQLDRVLAQAEHVVAVRIRTDKEDATLRTWLIHDRRNRAILFHSGLYPFAQGLFVDFPQQVTFGDLRPRFE